MFFNKKSPCKAVNSADHHGGYYKPDDSDKGQPEPPRAHEVFVRGLIEVEFKRSGDSGVENWKFGEEKRREEFSKTWSRELQEILKRNELVSWQPVFPLRYPWSPKESTECALEAYVEAGRDKFVKFDFAPGANVVRIAKELKEAPDLKQVAPIPELSAPAAPLTEPLVVRDHQGSSTNEHEDPRDQWYLSRCEVPAAWNLGASGHGVIIADIDWGFDRNHQDLISRITLAKSMIGNPNIVSHGNMRHHGTGVLGLAGAEVNDHGMAGIAYEATLWAIQAGSNNVMDETLWVAAINFVRMAPPTGAPKVIIVEGQTRGSSNIEAIPSIREEITAAINDGIVVIVPAGNGNETLSASVDDAGNVIPETGSIVVGATKFDPHKNERAESNGGARVTVYAPGDSDSDLTCGSPPNRYRLRFGGTSGAAAKVAGVVALMLEKNARLTPLEVSRILQRSSKDVVDEFDRNVGVLLDAHQAVSDAIDAAPGLRGLTTRPHS